jgi:hypothetical protein
MAFFANDAITIGGYSPSERDSLKELPIFETGVSLEIFGVLRVTLRRLESSYPYLLGHFTFLMNPNLLMNMV